MFATPQSRDGSIQFGTGLTNRLTATREPFLFGVRLWASICLALFVAFWLELDNLFGPVPPRLSSVSRSSELRCVRGGTG
jgi:hypothetical protein